MSTSLLLPNPCLLGIVFTIATHDGNQLVFHYPPKPNEFGFQATPLDITEVSNSIDGLIGSSDSENYDDYDDEDYGDEAEDDRYENDDDFVIDDDDDNDDDDNDDDDDDDDDNDIEFEKDSDVDSLGMKSHRTLSTESFTSDHNRHQRTSSSSNNRYQSGRDLLELLYEREQKKKKKKILKRKMKIKARKEKEKLKNKSESIDSQSLISSLKTSISENTHSNIINNNDNNNNNNKEKKEYKIEKLFSFDTEFISDLATPPKSLCNTRFELTVEDMVFLGLPIHVNEDGTWRVSKKSKYIRSKSMSTSQRSRKQSIAGSLYTEKESNSNTKNHDESNKINNNTNNTENFNDDHIDHHNDDEVLQYNGYNNKNKLEMEKDCGMYQFHMLFVMNPPVVEYNHRIDEMFHYIISRISLLLRYEQQKTNFVWNECKKIIKLREELIHSPIKQQWKSIISQSSLAKLICETYKSVSKSEIVNIDINGKLNSFQIPIRKEFVVLPPSYVDLPDCSTLSSISPFNQLNGYESSTSLTQASDIMAHFALILLDDTEHIIKDIKAEKDSVVASFIRMIKPNESLQRLSILSGLDIQEVKMFANHLVYWRRAMATLPLTSRSIYVISPIAPIKNIYQDSPDFNRTFPNLPPLPTFLSMISDISTSKPKTISNIIPSRDHRDLYMDAIAWLFKHGYIIQLYTFLYLKITKEIKIKVAEEVEIEIKRKQELKKKKNDLLVNTSMISENKRHDGIDNNKESSNIIDKINLQDLHINDDDNDNNDNNNNDNNNNNNNNNTTTTTMDIINDTSDENISLEESINNLEDNKILEDTSNSKLNTMPTDNSADATVEKIQNDDNPRSRSRSQSMKTDNLRNEKNDNKDTTSEVDEITLEQTRSHNQYIQKKSPTDETTNENNKNNGGLKLPPSEADSYTHPSNYTIQFEEEEEEDTILLEPEYSSSLERRWISKVVEGQPIDVSNLFYKVLKYMNGRNAQEVFLMQENISRTDMKRLCEAIADNLVVVRHW